MTEILRYPTSARFSQFETQFDSASNTLFWWMRPRGRPCFTARFLRDVEAFERDIQERAGHIEVQGKTQRVWNYVVGSRVPGIFNLGGDMSMFIQAIVDKDRPRLEAYARLCVDNMFRRIQGFDAEISTYSLIQGRAFGGGFECALASDTIVAERASTFCFPEVMFNMIPGMGAISLLGRRIGLSRAQEVVMSGQTFTAREMRDLGVVDELVENGTAEQSVRQIIADRCKRRNSYRALISSKRNFMPLNLDEMRTIVGVWVDAAFRLEMRDLKMMARLVRAQDRLLEFAKADPALDSLFEAGQGLSAIGRV
jgi:DSF synthase